jgi:hypothetical protein
MTIKSLAQDIAALCAQGETGDKTQALRQQIVSGLVTGLLCIDGTAADSDTPDSAVRGMKKVIF